MSALHFCVELNKDAYLLCLHRVVLVAAHSPFPMDRYVTSARYTAGGLMAAKCLRSAIRNNKNPYKTAN